MSAGNISNSVCTYSIKHNKSSIMATNSNKELPSLPLTKAATKPRCKVASTSLHDETPPRHQPGTSRRPPALAAHQETVKLRQKVETLEQALVERDMEIAALRQSATETQWVMDEGHRQDELFLRTVREALEARHASRAELYDGASVKSTGGTQQNHAAFSDSDSDYF